MVIMQFLLTVLLKMRKRAYDNDEGPNTGGMGAYCPVPHISNDVLERTNKDIAQPIARALKRRGL